MGLMEDRSDRRRRRQWDIVAAVVLPMVAFVAYIIGLAVLQPEGWLPVIPLFLIMAAGVVYPFWWGYHNAWRGYIPEPGWTFRDKDPEFPSLLRGLLVDPRDDQGKTLANKTISNVLNGKMAGRDAAYFQSADLAHGRIGFVAIKLLKTAPKLVIEPIWLSTGNILADRYVIASAIPTPIRGILAKIPYSLHCYASGDALVCLANMTPKSWPAYQQDQLKVLLAIADILDPQPDKQPQTDATMPAITRGVLHPWQPDEPTPATASNQPPEWPVMGEGATGIQESFRCIVNLRIRALVAAVDHTR